MDMIKTGKKRWVLVADGGKAKILTHYDKSFQVIYQVESPNQRTPSKDMSTDKDGNFYANKHHSKGNSADLHELAESRFIAELSGLLEKQYHAGKFFELSLVMPPKALGKMRQCLGKNIRAAVNKEYAKDFSHFPEKELFNKLSKIL